MTGAGESARRVSESAERSAEKYEKRAANARRRADNFATGAEGEEAVAKALTPLMISGWYVLNDRADPAGGNIDHIVVGPGAVIVLDAKAWNSKLEVRNGKLYASGWNKARELDRLARQADAVREALGGEVIVDHALVITTQPDFEPQTVGTAGVLGLGFLHSEISQSPTIYSRQQVDSMVTRLIEAFPIAGTIPSAASGLQVVEGVDPNPLFERGNRFVYLKQWSNYGKRRIYVSDEHGDELGVKDLQSGEIKLSHDDDAITRAVLFSATTKGVKIEAGDLPKIPIEIPGGRLLGLFGKLYMTVLIGSLWTGNGKRYLYGTLANPTEGVFELGHVDLATGWVKPKSTGPLSRDRGPAERYLALLRDRCPYE